MGRLTKLSAVPAGYAAALFASATSAYVLLCLFVLQRWL